jgi:hypothetical protein
LKSHMRTNQNNMIYIDKIRPGEDVGVNGSKGAVDSCWITGMARKMVKNAGLDNSDQYHQFVLSRFNIVPVSSKTL